MVAETADKTRLALDLRQAIALRALACGLGWPGVCRGEPLQLATTDTGPTQPARQRPQGNRLPQV